MATTVALPISRSKARMRLMNNQTGLMALCKNMTEPIRACNFVFEIFDFET
jgi:hypothetical protein